MNSLQVQRMLRHFNEAHKAEEAAEPAPKAPRAPRQKKAAPPPPASDSISDSGSDSGSESDPYGDYKEVHEIKQHFEKEPCEYISPAALGQATTKKEAVEYLQSKKCPKVDHVKKSAAKSTMESGPVSPLPPAAAPAKKVRKPKVEAAPAPAPEPVAPAPAPKVKKVKVAAAAPAPAPAPAPPAAAPAAPAAAAKAKRPASEYAKLVGKYIKEQKLSLGDAAKKAKADLDAKKKA